MSECIFCKIIKGEIPSAVIYEDGLFKVIPDKFPSSPGHSLIIVKEHIPDIFSLPPETADKLFPIAAELAGKLKSELKCDGVNILQNNGAASGQTVFHFHVHIIPRYKNDSVNISWESCALSDETVAEMSERLKINLRPL